MPEPFLNPIGVYFFVVANHVGNVVTRISHSGILIFVNNTQIIVFIKRHNTMYLSTYGYDLGGVGIIRDLSVALRIKLRMFGVPIYGPSDFYCYNKGVLDNTSASKSIISKKHKFIN